MNVHIRTIKPHNAADWASLRVAFLPEIHDINQAEVDAFFLGQNPNLKEAIVALDQTQNLIGFIELNLRHNVPGSHQNTTPYIEAWYVLPSFQGQGIGQALIKAAEEWAIQQGFTELASDTPIANEKSISLHKKMGFKEIERVVCLLKPLSDE